MLFRLWLQLCNTLKINFKIHKKLILWLTFCVTAGIVIGIITIVSRGIDIDDISDSLVDQNIIASAGVDTGFGTFILQRIMTLFLPLSVLFLFAVCADWVALIVFPLFIMQGYWLAMSIWWTICYYSVGAIFLLGFYIAWLLIVTAVLLAGAVWIMKLTSAIRCLGFRPGCNRREIWTGLGVLLLTAAVLAVIEFLVYWVFLGRIVFHIE